MKDFDASEFARRFQSGEFDSRLHETLQSLTTSQLEEVESMLKPWSFARSAPRSDCRSNSEASSTLEASHLSGDVVDDRQ
jgi:hypothetical protein